MSIQVQHRRTGSVPTVGQARRGVWARQSKWNRCGPRSWARILLAQYEANDRLAGANRLERKRSRCKEILARCWGQSSERVHRSRQTRMRENRSVEGSFD